GLSYTGVCFCVVRRFKGITATAVNLLLIKPRFPSGSMILYQSADAASTLKRVPASRFVFSAISLPILLYKTDLVVFILDDFPMFSAAALIFDGLLASGSIHGSGCAGPAHAWIARCRCGEVVFALPVLPIRHMRSPRLNTCPSFTGC